jgi:uncharacterized protein (TIGR02246 family)
MSPRSAEDLVLEWREALLARDAPRFAAMFAPDGTLFDVEHPTLVGSRARPVVGREEIERVTTDWLEATPSFKYEIVDVIPGGDRAAARWRYRVDAIELDGLTWLSCRNGSILLALVLFDSRVLLEAGEVPPEELKALDGWLRDLRAPAGDPFVPEDTAQ